MLGIPGCGRVTLRLFRINQSSDTSKCYTNNTRVQYVQYTIVLIRVLYSTYFRESYRQVTFQSHNHTVLFVLYCTVRSTNIHVDITVLQYVTLSEYHVKLLKSHRIKWCGGPSTVWLRNNWGWGYGITGFKVDHRRDHSNHEREGYSSLFGSVPAFIYFFNERNSFRKYNVVSLPHLAEWLWMKLAFY